MKKISIIIVAYKNGIILKNTLNSIELFNDIGDDLEIIVVDNSPSEENVKRYVEDSKASNCIYIKCNNNGFGAGNNTGVEHSSGEILAFLNPDVILVEPIFNDIYYEFVNRKELMMLGCQILDASKKKVPSFFYDYEDTFFKRILIKFYNYTGFYNKDTMFVSGCNMFIRKEAFIKAEGFDENIFMYNEEADIKKRIIETFQKCDIHFYKKHSMIHLEERKEFSEERFKNHKDSTIYFGKKYNLDYRKKLRYEYRKSIIKLVLFSLTNNKKKTIAKKEKSAFERNYFDIIY